MFNEYCPIRKGPLAFRVKYNFRFRSRGVVRQAHPAELRGAIGPEGHVDIVWDEGVTGSQIPSIFERASLGQQSRDGAAFLIGHGQIGWGRRAAKWSVSRGGKRLQGRNSCEQKCEQPFANVPA